MILLISYGNTLRRDDGAGPALARMVAKSGIRDDLRVLTVHQLAPEIAEELAAPDVDAVLFMDACVGEAGEDRESYCDRVEIREVTSEAPSTVFGHNFSPSLLLAYAKSLYGATPPAWLVSIPGYDFGFGEKLSERTERMLASAVDEVAGILQSLP